MDSKAEDTFKWKKGARGLPLGMLALLPLTSEKAYCLGFFFFFLLRRMQIQWFASELEHAGRQSVPRPPALTLTTSPLQSFARLSAQCGCDDCQHLMPSLSSAWKSVRDTPPWFLCFCSSSQLVPMPGLNASASPCFLNQFCMVGKIAQ